jgi:hypothetical protein
MMRIHLRSIRQFHPTAPILISKKGGQREEMEEYRAEFGVRYWLEELSWDDASLRLMERCETEYACLMDADTILLSSVDPLLQGLVEDRYDLVGIEERIREAPTVDWRTVSIWNGWFRFAPGMTDATFLLFNLRRFLKKWGLRGVRGKRPYGAWGYEYHYGICSRLPRHKYLLPYHCEKYGIGNLLKDGDTPILWHQWWGSHSTRVPSDEVNPYFLSLAEAVRAGESTFLADYPKLDWSCLTPAWGPEFDITAEQRRAEEANSGTRGLSNRVLEIFRRLRFFGVRGLFARGVSRLDRWRRYLKPRMWM